MTDKPWEERYLEPLLGGKVVEVGVTEEDEEGWMYIVVESGDNAYTLEISQDEEGNGPGFVLGLPYPPTGGG